jgi:hypothetical protein
MFFPSFSLISPHGWLALIVKKIKLESFKYHMYNYFHWDQKIDINL